MRTLKGVTGIVAALLPIVYCGWLIYYFFDGSGGSLEQVDAEGLSPTLLGLGVVGLLLCIPLIYKIIRMINGPRSPRSDGRNGPRTSAGGDDETGFDADAVVARYMSQRAAEAAPGAPTAPSAHQPARPTRPTGFGRKVR